MEESLKSYREEWRKRFRENQKKVEAYRESAMKAARQCGELLRKEYDVKAVYLIGSLTGGQYFDLRSDIDLVVEGLAPEEYISAYGDCRDCISDDLDIDLIPLEDAVSGVRNEVKRRGKQL